jgi:hypothetical protein
MRPVAKSEFLRYFHHRPASPRSGAHAGALPMPPTHHEAVAGSSSPTPRCETEGGSTTRTRVPSISDHSAASVNRCVCSEDGVKGRNEYRAKRQEYVRLVVAGRSRREISNILGVQPRTLSRWRSEPEVRAEIEALTSSANATEISAVAALRGLLTDPDSRVRLEAARAILAAKIEVPTTPPAEVDEPTTPSGYIVVRQAPLP